MKGDILFKDFLSGATTFKQFLRGCPHEWVLEKSRRDALGSYSVERFVKCKRTRLVHGR